LLVGGGLAITAAQTFEVISGSRADLGSSISFEAGNERYSLVLIRGEINDSSVTERRAAEVICLAQFADGTQASIDGSKQSSRDETPVGISIGTFAATAGPARVLCDRTDSQRLIIDRYAVAAEQTTAKYIAYGLLAAGLLAAAAAVGLIIIGVRGRQVVEPAPTKTT
jgi:hypothetical protein